MESSIRDIFIFWKLNWGVENYHTLFKKWCLGAIYHILTVAHIHIIYILYTYYIHIIYILYTYYIHIIYILYTYYIHIKAFLYHLWHMLHSTYSWQRRTSSSCSASWTMAARATSRARISWRCRPWMRQTSRSTTCRSFVDGNAAGCIRNMSGKCLEYIYIYIYLYTRNIDILHIDIWNITYM